MINAFIYRRYSLLKNSLLSTLIVFFCSPLLIFIFVNLVFRKVLVNNYYDISFDVWIYPSMIFIVSSFSILPSIFRDLYDLRIHQKLLTYISLSPYSKSVTIFSFLVISLLEGFVMGVFSVGLFSIILVFPFDITKTIVLIGYLLIFIFIVGNFLITIALSSTRSTTYILYSILLLFYIVLGSGLIVEQTFFSDLINSVLFFSPINMIIHSMQSYLYSSFMNWELTILSILIGIGWTFINSSILKRKLRQ